MAGIDAHARSLSVCVVQEAGRPVARREVANDPEGHADLAGFLLDGLEEPVARVGIEGAGGAGLCLAWHLRARGLSVCEVPAHYTRRERRRLRGAGKSDARDALAIARVVACEEWLPPVRLDDKTRELKLLVDYRRQLIEERTRVANRLRADLRVLFPDLALTSLARRRARALARVRLRRDPRAQAALARRRLARIEAIDREAGKLTRTLGERVEASGSGLTALCGISTLNAARILGEVGDIARFRSADAFAAANGTAPIPASSGNTTRMLLNRHGNRRLNYALHAMALTQIRCDPRARDYYRRRREQGNSALEALRALKRHLSNVVYRQLVADAQVVP